MTDDLLFRALGESLGEMLVAELERRDARLAEAEAMLGELRPLRASLDALDASIEPRLAEAAQVGAEAQAARLGELHAELLALAARVEDLPARLDALADDALAGLTSLSSGFVDGIDARAREAIASVHEQLVKAFAEHAHLAAELRAWLAEAKARDGDAPEPGPPGPPGPPGSLAEVRAYVPGEIVEAGDMRLRDGVGGGVFVALARTYDPPGDPSSEDWRLCIANGRDGQGFAFRGVYQPGSIYARGDVVLGESGALWVWLGETASSEVLPGDCWRLFMKQGQRGRQGKSGDKGDKGDKGEPGVGIDDVSLEDDGTLVFFLSDGTQKTVHLREGAA